VILIVIVKLIVALEMRPTLRTMLRSTKKICRKPVIAPIFPVALLAALLILAQCHFVICFVLPKLAWNANVYP